MPTIELHGVDVHYETHGRGRDVVLLHAGGASGAQWRPLAPLLVDEHRMVAPDLFGFGKTGQWMGATL